MKLALPCAARCDDYRTARVMAVERGATHAAEPSGYAQSFYKRGRFPGTAQVVWYDCLVLRGHDGHWYVTTWTLDPHPPVGSMGSLPFVKEIEED